jgi:hypothetical protein
VGPFLLCPQSGLLLVLVPQAQLSSFHTMDFWWLLVLDGSASHDFVGDVVVAKSHLTVAFRKSAIDVEAHEKRPMHEKDQRKQTK